MAKNDGGPAFPGAHYTPDGILELLPGGGMSLRDWLAGMALQGMLSYYCSLPNIAAEKAYKHADAMIKERENG